jgi:pimeloyl-ACP methyl ester carboxylesterase
MPFAKANGIDLFYEEAGDKSAPVIVLIMGLGAPLTFWPEPFVDALVARDFRVLRFDNRDFGLSTKFHAATVNVEDAYVRMVTGQKIASPYTLEDMAKDVIGLLDALGIDKAHIVGASMGGMIGQIIAADHADRVLSLTSVMSTSGDPGLPQGKPEALAVLNAAPPAPDDRAANIEHGLRCQRAIGSSILPSSDEALRAKVAEGYDRSNDYTGAPRQLVAVMANGSRVALLKRIGKPTLVIHGMADPLIPREGGEDTARHISGAELMLVEGMGHDLPEPLIDELAEAVAVHCRRASAAA